MFSKVAQCNTFTVGYRRSAATELPTEETPDNEEAVVAELDEDIVPMPFDLDKELSHIKAHRQKRQGSNQKDKYVLYILDSSGSIGETNFKNLTNVMAQFSLFYCTGTKIVVMSYSSNVYKNYCFNCDQDTLPRYTAINNITFHNQLTASGNAIHCACDYMLRSPCGFPHTTGRNAPELDVIFITDGHSNHGQDVCTAASCWSDFYNINVFPIGIGNHVNYRELNCIKGSVVNGVHQFNLRNFKELLTLLADVKEDSKKGKCI